MSIDKSNFDLVPNHISGKPLSIVVLYSGGHMGSSVVLNRLLKMPCYKVVGVVKAQPVALSRSGVKKVRKQFRKTGWRFGWLLLWQRSIQAIGFLLTLINPFGESRIKPAWKLAHEHNLPILQTQNINSEEALKFLRKLNPDLFVSAYFSQILKSEVIAVPKMGVLNVHPGWLPAYKGAMSYFWVLKHKESRAGVSLHWIDEGIDTGKLISRKSFLLKQGMTQENVLAYSAVIGSRLLFRAGMQLSQGQDLGETTIAEDEADAYYAMPGEADFESYFKENRFFRIRDVFSLLNR